MSAEFQKLLPALIKGGVDFVLIGGGSYDDLLPHSVEIEAFGVRFRCVDFPTLIRIKAVAGRAKDREAIAELRVLLEEQNKR